MRFHIVSDSSCDLGREELERLDVAMVSYYAAFDDEIYYGCQPLQNGGGEGTGLACAGLGAAQHIPPGQGGGDCLLLDGRGFDIALLLQGL